MAACDFRTQKRLFRAVASTLTGTGSVKDIDAAIKLVPGDYSTDTGFIAAYIFASAHVPKTALDGNENKDEIMSEIAGMDPSVDDGL